MASTQWVDEYQAHYNEAVQQYGLAWRNDAACHGADAFATGHAARVFVRNYCDQCAVRATCLAFAVTARIEHGVWGGIGKPADRAAAMARIDR